MGQDHFNFTHNRHEDLSALIILSNRLMIFPISVGNGKRLFREGSEKKVLKLVETKTFSSGVVVLTYQSERKG
jgi:hypothetical protein